MQKGLPCFHGHPVRFRNIMQCTKNLFGCLLLPPRDDSTPEWESQKGPIWTGQHRPSERHLHRNRRAANKLQPQLWSKIVALDRQILPAHKTRRSGKSLNRHHGEKSLATQTQVLYFSSGQNEMAQKYVEKAQVPSFLYFPSSLQKGERSSPTECLFLLRAVEKTPLDTDQPANRRLVKHPPDTGWNKLIKDPPYWKQNKSISGNGDKN